ncbi:MAG: helix-turn-helix transcriptional regulator [Tetrasphaera sp.]
MSAPADHVGADPQLLSEDDLNRVYGALVRLPEPSRAALIETGLPADLVDRATKLLQARGLLATADHGRWDVPAPDIAITAWAADAERRARAWRASAGQLHQLFLAARTDEVVDSGNRELATLADIASATATITAAAKREILSVRADSRRTHQLLLDPFNSHRELFRNAAGELVRLRAVYDPAVLDVPGALDALRERMTGGEQIRLASGIHFSAVVVDDVAAVVEFSNIETSGAGSMLLRRHPFVAAVMRLGESLFATGVPLPMGEDGPALDGAADRDALILSLLASGASDSTITRRLGISQRTVERRVRHIMDGLGADTRFQAGVRAARQGLV